MNAFSRLPKAWVVGRRTWNMRQKARNKVTKAVKNEKTDEATWIIFSEYDSECFKAVVKIVHLAHHHGLNSNLGKF